MSRTVAKVVLLAVIIGLITTLAVLGGWRTVVAVSGGLIVFGVVIWCIETLLNGEDY